MPRKLLALAATLAMLATAFEAGAACTAANPNANVIESTPTSAFTVHGDGTVTHALTGLMWKQAVQGPMVWSAALATAAADTTAGHSDWRLPNKKELESIVENCGFGPSINQTVFPGTPASFFWSGSSYVPGPFLAWGVRFDVGGTVAGAKTDNYYVRLVRGGQLFDSFDAQGDITPPVLTAAGVSGTTATATTLSATSDEAATGYWIVVPQGSAAPTAAEVKAGADYGAVTLTAKGNGAMTVATPQNFSVTGLTAATAYDLYLVAEDASSNHNLTPATIKIQFTTATTPVNGACDATNDGQTLTVAPSVNLCTAGSASAVASGTTAYTWSCTGSGGGSTASCSATRNYVVTSSVSGGNGSISASQNVAYNAQPVFTLTPNAGYTSGPVTGNCGGSLAGNSYTTSAVTASCSVVAGFTAAATVPGAPTIGAATPGNGSASIAFTAPASNGGSAITGYTASCTAGVTTITGAGTVSPIGVSGLTNGTAYSCSVTASNAVGTGAASGTVNVTPAAAAIPTLSEWSMLILASLLGLIGFKRVASRARR